MPYIQDAARRLKRFLRQHGFSMQRVLHVHLTLRPRHVQHPALDLCESRGGLPVEEDPDARSLVDEGLESRGANGGR